MNYFIAGTDTEIGKTTLTTGLLLAFANSGKRVAGMKPVAAGYSDTTGRNNDADTIYQYSMRGLQPAWINPYLFAAPTSPHIAAKLENKHINWSTINESFDQLAKRAEIVIVEGVGGWAVPLSNELTSSDIPLRLGLEVVLVVGIRLGAINHALLTARAIQADNCKLCGWIANVIDPNYPYQRETIDTLKQRIDAPCLAEVPWLPSATPQALLPLLKLVPLTL